MNADLSDPVKFHALSFSNISGTLSNLADFIGSLETGDAPSYAKGSDDGQRKEIRLDSLQKGKTLQISWEIVPILDYKELTGSLHREFV